MAKEYPYFVHNEDELEDWTCLWEIADDRKLNRSHVASVYQAMLGDAFEYHYDEFYQPYIRNEQVEDLIKLL